MRCCSARARSDLRARALLPGPTPPRPTNAPNAPQHRSPRSLGSRRRPTPLRRLSLSVPSPKTALQRPYDAPQTPPRPANTPNAPRHRSPRSLGSRRRPTPRQSPQTLPKPSSMSGRFAPSLDAPTSTVVHEPLVPCETSKVHKAAVRRTPRACRNGPRPVHVSSRFLARISSTRRPMELWVGSPSHPR